MITPQNTAKIYKIVNTIDDMIYIGSTTQRLTKRMQNHRGRASKVEQYNCKFHRHMNTIGLEHFKIILLKIITYSSKDEIEVEEFNEISKVAQEKLLNENVVYKRRSPEHIKKVADAQRGPKSINWKYGSVFKRIADSKDGYAIDSWCFSYRLEDQKQKRCQFSIKKYGDETAHQMAKNKRLEIFPEAPEI